MNRTAFFFFLLFGLSARCMSKATGGDYDHHLYLQQIKEKINSDDDPTCSSVFQQVGDHCLFVDKALVGTWQVMRKVCNDLGGDLVNLQDANFLADIIDHLTSHDLAGVDFWVGSNDLLREGVWQWVNDNSQVKMGTPLWGDEGSNPQQPQGGTDENCGALSYSDHYFMQDTPCDTPTALLCEQYDVPSSNHNMLTGGNTTTEPSNVECPYPYEVIHGKCLFFNNLATTTWESHRVFCENLGGHMLKVDDANVLGAIYDHLTIGGITGPFWIGATDDHQEGNWFWLDGTEVRLGTPFWGDDGDKVQNPDGGVTDNCALLCWEDHFFMHDSNCDGDHHVICQIDI